MSFSFSITSASKAQIRHRVARLVANNSIPISDAAATGSPLFVPRSLYRWLAREGFDLSNIREVKRLPRRVR